MEEFDDAVVGVAFEEAFTDVEDIDEAFLLEPHAEEFDDDFFVFFWNGGDGFGGDVFGEDEVAGFSAKEKAKIEVAEDDENDDGQGFVDLEKEVEGGVDGDGDEEAFEDGFLAEAFAEWEVEEFGDPFCGLADAVTEFFVMCHDNGVFADAIVVAENAGEDDVGAGGEDGAENVEAEEFAGGELGPELIEVVCVFNEREAEGGDDRVFDGVVDGLD